MINQEGYGVVIGVLSFGQPVDCSPTDVKCFMNYDCNLDEVAVYTRVSPYIPWIKKTTGLGKLSILVKARHNVGKRGNCKDAKESHQFEYLLTKTMADLISS